MNAHKRQRIDPTTLTKTGWPPSELMQDDCKGLSRWLSTRLGARIVLKKMYEAARQNANNLNSDNTLRADSAPGADIRTGVAQRPGT